MTETFKTITGYTPVTDGQLYYEVTGTGQPLVLVHASCADHSMWDEQVKAFAPHYQVIRYDRRGFGKTTANQLDESVPFFDAQDLQALLQHLNIPRTHLLGLSGGGAISVDFALAFPDQITALIVVAAAFGGFEGQATTQEQAHFGEYMRLLAAKDWERLAQLGAREWVDGPLREPDESRQKIRAEVYQWALDIQKRGEGMTDPRLLTPPAAGRLSEIKAPTLVIYGDVDLSMIISAGETLASRISGAQKKVFEDTAHMVNLERPAQFNQVMLDFLQANS